MKKKAAIMFTLVDFTIYANYSKKRNDGVMPWFALSLKT